MEQALWYLVAGTRGGPARTRVVRILSERPYNANQVAERLDVDYNTARHHLEMLARYDVVESNGATYGELYFLTDRFERHRETFERIARETVDEGRNRTVDTDQEERDDDAGHPAR